MINFGAVPAGAVLPIMFTTYAGATGASVTLTGLAVTDIEVYKGTSMTQRASDAGYALMDTDGIDIDSTTGLHGFSIDTGDNTDSGFYAAGSFYNVVVNAVTVDSQTVVFIAATFRLVAAETVAGTPKADTSHFGGTAGTFSSGRPEVNASHFAGTAYATALAAEVDAIHDEQVDGTTTLRQSMRLHNAVLGGKASGLATTTAVYRDLADSKDRVSATVDADGNRSAITRDLT
jgi:hypothetical protein